MFTLVYMCYIVNQLKLEQVLLTDVFLPHMIKEIVKFLLVYVTRCTYIQQHIIVENRNNDFGK